MGDQRRRRVVSIISAFVGASAGSGGLSLTVTPASFTGAAFDTTDPRVFGPCTALPAGGSGSYTYAWTVLSTTSAVAIVDPTSPTTDFVVNALFGDTSYSIVRCTVTDTDTLATARADVPLVYAVYDSGSPL
jgi:hypothetical protein